MDIPVAKPADKKPHPPVNAGYGAKSDMDLCVKTRRKALAKEGTPVQSETWGLALSGGGIRSATFCLGLVSGLAQQKIFHRFDYLSTVSGGGYIGAALGKLYCEKGASAAVREQQLAGAQDTWLVWWLRATSRYLTPRGAKDLLNAGALMFRNLLGIHLELALVGILIGVLLAGTNMLAWWGLHALSQQPSAVTVIVNAGAVLQPWMSLWWLVAAVFLLAPLPYMAAYWAVPGGRRQGGLTQTWRWLSYGIHGLMGIMAICMAYGRDDFWNQQPDGVLRMVCGVVGLAFVCVATAPVLAVQVAKEARQKAPYDAGHATVRNLLTARLANWLKWILRLLAIGAFDRLGWFLAFGELTWDHWALTPAVVVATLLATRILAARVHAPAGTPPAGRALRRRVVDALGLALLSLLLGFWISVVYQHGLGALFLEGGPLAFGNALYVLAGFGVAPVIYIALSRSNVHFLNVSSLHMFYRARLCRSYLGSTNRSRFGNQDPLDRVATAGQSSHQAAPSVFEVHPADSIRMGDYAPHHNGGPVHLINVTVNQSFDARGGLYNQDRKGQSLSVAGGGLWRVGSDDWKHSPDVARSELQQWMAISGAAFTPGLGGQTSSGLAALLFMAGVRLGYWWDHAPFKGWSRLAPKYRLMLDEARGQFGGVNAPYWYLSDGGHFENTGAYALLRQGVDLIVLADCGADPRYSFDDVENLVRKARIDLGVEIEFQRVVGAPPSNHFGSIGDLKDPQGSACLAVAKVFYPGRANPGHLVLVKPNIYHGLPIDLINYKIDCDSFPQETTTDQFFSEAQWESYFKLGRCLGMTLDARLLQGLPDNASFQPDTPSTKPEAPTPKAHISPGGSWIPSRVAPSVRSGLGALGALALALAAYQGWTAMQRAYTIEASSLRELLGRVVLLSEQHGPESPQLRIPMAVITQRFCTPPQPLAFITPTMIALFDAVIEGCKKSDAMTNPSCEALLKPATNACLHPPPRKVPVYWGADFSSEEVRRKMQEEASSSARQTALSASPPSDIDLCRGKTIYLWTHGSGREADTARLTKRWNEWTTVLPQTKYVVASAAEIRRPIQRPQPTTTVTYHTPGDIGCAIQIKMLSDWKPIDLPITIQPLPSGYRGRAGTIDVWLASPIGN